MLSDSSDLVVDHIYKSFGNERVLTSVTFAVKTGERVAIVGPNGSGKTTLLNIISGWLQPDSGNVTWKGFDLTRHAPEFSSRLGIARTFQYPRVFGDLTVNEHFLLAMLGLKSYGLISGIRRIWGKPLSRVSDRVIKWLSAYWKKEFLKQTADQLSYGQQKALNIACALIRQPHILLLDEPFSGMDKDVRKQIMNWLFDADGPASEVSILYVEHESIACQSERDRTIILNNSPVK